MFFFLNLIKDKKDFIIFIILPYYRNNSRLTQCSTKINPYPNPYLNRDPNPYLNRDPNRDRK